MKSFSKINTFYFILKKQTEKREKRGGGVKQKIQNQSMVNKTYHIAIKHFHRATLESKPGVWGFNTNG